MLRTGSIVLRCTDLAGQEAFWTAALGHVPYEASRDTDFIILRPPDGSGPNLSLDSHTPTCRSRPGSTSTCTPMAGPPEVERLKALGATEVQWSSGPPTPTT